MQRIVRGSRDEIDEGIYVVYEETSWKAKLLAIDSRFRMVVRPMGDLDCEMIM